MVRAFTDQVVVIAGAAGGVGQAFATLLAAQGAILGLVGRRLKTLEQVAASIQKSGQQISCYEADLTVDEDIRNLAAHLRRDFRHIDVLIHTAGVTSLGSIEQGRLGDLDWQYRTNVRGPYALTQALLPLIRARRGQIVFINSTLGLYTKPGAGQYAATKHALKAITDTLRDEVNNEGIRVLSVFLGRTATPMQAAVHEMEGRAYRPENLLQPEDVASLVVHALSLPASAEVTAIHIRPSAKPV